MLKFNSKKKQQINHNKNKNLIGFFRNNSNIIFSFNNKIHLFRHNLTIFKLFNNVIMNTIKKYFEKYTVKLKKYLKNFYICPV